MPRFKAHYHLDLNLFRLGLLLGKPRGVDPSYYVRLKINSRSWFQLVKGLGEDLAYMLKQQCNVQQFKCKASPFLRKPKNSA